MAAMKNYKQWVKEQGSRFIESVRAEYDADSGSHGGGSDDPDFLDWVDDHDHLVQYATEVGESWSLAEINFVNSNSPNREDQAVSKHQAVDAFVRDISRVVKQLWKKR